MIDQMCIFTLSVISGWLLTGKNPKVKRWGPIFGLAGQPFLIYATWKAGQWGMFALSLYWTFAWVRGIYNDWSSEFTYFFRSAE